MSDLAKLREGVKKNVRALLISAPTGVTAHQIDKDYLNLTGNSLPYRKLGYNSTLEFLKAIPDCAEFCYDRGQLILRAVADDTTKHIASLVARQKISSKSRRGRGRGRMGRGHPSFVRKIPPPAPRGPVKPLVAELPSVPASVRAKIKELLSLYPNGLLGSSFNTAFARRFGHHVNFTAMGFKSLGDVLKAVPDLISIHQLSGGGFKILGKVENLSDSIRHRDGDQGLQRIKNIFPRKDDLTNRRENNNERNGRENIIGRNEEAEHIDKKTKTAEVRFKEKQRDQTNRVADQMTNMVGVSDIKEEESVFHEPNYISESTPDENIDEELKEEIRDVLSKRPAGMWAARLPHEYKKNTGKDLPLKQLGYYSVIELVSLMTDIVSIKRPTPKGDWLLYDAQHHQDQSQASSEVTSSEVTRSEVTRSSPKKPKSGKPVDDSLKRNIWYTLSSQCSGTFLSNFQSLYFSHTKLKLFPQDYGFADLVSLFRAVPDVVEIKERINGTIVLHANPDYHSPSEAIPDVAQVQTKVLWHRSQGVPPDAVGGGVSYTTLSIPSDAEILEVYLASVVSPESFCIQIKSDETSIPLDIVMDALEKIYCYPEGDQYLMPDSMLTVGQVCVAIYQQDNNWHRASITGIRDSEFIEILYVDYGNTATVPKSCLRLLKSVFLHLPAQAVPSRLANVRSAKGVWTKATRDRILELCKDRPLIAWVVGIEHGVVSCCLCDTSSDVDIHLNDVLIAEGHAVFWPDKPTVSTHQQPEMNTKQQPVVNTQQPEIKKMVEELQAPQPETTTREPVCSKQPETKPVTTMPGTTPQSEKSETKPVGSAQSEIETKPVASNTQPERELMNHQNGALSPEPQSAVCSEQGQPKVDAKTSTTMLEETDPMIAIDVKNMGCSLTEEDIELMEQINRELDGVLDISVEDEVEDTEVEIKPRNVKPVKLGSRVMAHIIKYESEAYMLSGEISSYLWEIDMLRAMLRKANVGDVKRIIMAKKDHLEFFEEIKSYNVPGCMHGDDVKPYLTFYHLSSISKILKILKCKNEELIPFMEQEWNNFDPDDGYWKGQPLAPGEEQGVDANGDEDSDEVQVMVYDLDVDDLKLMLQAMQFKRMRILQAMISDPETCMVDELQYVERQMTRIRNAIKQKEETGNGDQGDEGAKVTFERSKRRYERSKIRDQDEEKAEEEEMASSVQKDVDKKRGNREARVEPIMKREVVKSSEQQRPSSSSEPSVPQCKEVPSMHLEPPRKVPLLKDPPREEPPPYMQETMYQPQQYPMPGPGATPMYGTPYGQLMSGVPPQHYIPTQMVHPSFVGQTVYHPQQQLQDYYSLQPYLYNQFGYITGRGRGTAQMLRASNVIPGHCLQNYRH